MVLRDLEIMGRKAIYVLMLALAVAMAPNVTFIGKYIHKQSLTITPLGTVRWGQSAGTVVVDCPESSRRDHDVVWDSLLWYLTSASRVASSNCRRTHLIHGLCRYCPFVAMYLVGKVIDYVSGAQARGAIHCLQCLTNGARKV